MAVKKRRKQRRHPQERGRFALPFDRILVYAVAFFVFAIPLFIWPGITEYGYGKSIVALIALSVLFVLWGIVGWRGGAWRIRLPWIVFPVLLFVIASLFSLLHAMNGRVVVQSLVLVVYFFAFAVLVANVVREPRDVTLLLFAMLGAGFFAALYGLLQYLGVLPGATGGSGLSEVISTVGNRNYLGGFLSYLLFPSVVLIVRPRSRVLRGLAILLIAFCFGLCLLVDQQGILVGLFVAAVAWLIGWLIFRPVEPIRRNRVWLLALLGVLFFTGLVQAPSGPLNSVVGLSADGGSWIGRLWQQSSGSVRAWDWWVGWEMFEDHPITGVGLGNYKLNFVPYKARFLATPRGESYNFYIARAAQAHNEYVQVAAETGSLGLLAIAGLLGTLVVSLWRRLRRNADEADRFDLLLYAAGLVSLFVHALVSFPAHLPSSSLAGVVVLGIAFSRAYGNAASVEVVLRRRALRAALVAIAAGGLFVSIVAARDLAANVLMGEGTKQLQLGRVHQAEALFTRSIAFDFCPRHTYYYLATAQLRLGRYEEAFENLERCLTRFTDEKAYLAYANVAANLGRTGAAREAVELLLASHPHRETEVQARYIQAMIVYREDPTKGVALLDALVARDPSFALAHIALGNIFQARAMPVNARKHFQAALNAIDVELRAAERRLSQTATLSYAEYGQLRERIDGLTQQRQTVLAKLGELPSAP